MPDELRQELLKRSPNLMGGASAKIGAAPEPSISRKLLELVTGYPADPNRDIDPLDALQMLTVGMGAAKGVSKGIKMLQGVPDALPEHAISKDPYGLAEGPTGRRQFIDR